MNIKLKFKLEKKIAYVLTAAFILGSIVQSNTSIKGEMKEAVTTMGEVLEEIPENEQGMDYIIMTNEQGNFTETFEKVELTEETADELQEKFDDVIIERDSMLEASLIKTDKLKELNKDVKEESVPTKSEIQAMKRNKKIKKEFFEKQGKEDKKVTKEETEWSIQAINAENLDPESKNESKIKVAVLDSGVDIVNGIDLAKSVNLVPEEKSITQMFLDLTGHGTGIASIIAGNDEGDIQGINPNVELYSVKVLDKENKAPLSRIIEGIYWCIENDVNIINMSFGTPVCSYAMEKAVQDAYDANILMVGASGNHADNVEYPAAFDEVMAVAATNTNSEIAAFSNTGEKLEVAAPGEKIKAAGFFNGSIITHGTSIAVPHVVGVASLLWEKDMSKSNEFIRQLINYSSKNISNIQGCGLIDAEQAFKIYDDFSENFDGSKLIRENTIPENMEQPETFENIENDKTYVEGRWKTGLSYNGQQNSKGHLQIVDEGNTSITDLNTINIIKAGAIYPDIDKSGWNNEDSWFPEWHGGWQFTHYSYTIPVNYISCYEFVTRVALKSGNTSSFTSYTQIAGIDSAIFEWMKQDLNNINWNSALSGYTVNNANKKFFLWGCALHNLTDTFAHSTKYKNNGVIGNDIGHPDADDPTVRSNRFVVAKSAVSYSLKCLVNNVYGDYFEIYQALKYGKHDNSWVKKKLLPYAKSNAISLTSGETTYFTKASN